jgi:hypothetical protein
MSRTCDDSIVRFTDKMVRVCPVPSDESLGYPQSSAYADLANYFLCKAM